MTYSRWSTTCDIYAYQGVDGEIVLHVNQWGIKTFTFSNMRQAIEKLCQLAVEGVRFPDDLVKKMERDL